jgi:hypothetical protein
MSLQSYNLHLMKLLVNGDNFEKILIGFIKVFINYKLFILRQMNIPVMLLFLYKIRLLCITDYQ